MGSGLASCPRGHLPLVLGRNEPDRPLGRVRRRHEFAQGLEDLLEVLAQMFKAVAGAVSVPSAAALVIAVGSGPTRRHHVTREDASGTGQSVTHLQLYRKRATAPSTRPRWTAVTRGFTITCFDAAPAAIGDPAAGTMSGGARAAQHRPSVQNRACLTVPNTRYPPRSTSPPASRPRTSWRALVRPEVQACA